MSSLRDSAKATVDPMVVNSGDRTKPVSHAALVRGDMGAMPGAK